jgi:hypothetical protein
VQDRVARPWRVRLLRALLRGGLTSPLFGPALRLGRLLRPLLPPGLRDKLPPAAAGPAPAPAASAPLDGRSVIPPRGCVQPHLRPAIDAATERVLAALGDRVLRPAAGACCGAIPAHLDDLQAARAQARANIDAWWPLLESGAAAAIVSNASACGLTLRDYPDLVPPMTRCTGRARVASPRPVSISRCGWPAGARRGRQAGPQRQARRWPGTRPARCSTGWRQRRRSRPPCANSGSILSARPMPTCAAARPGRGRYSTRSWPTACVTASWMPSTPCPGTWSSPPTSAASSTLPRVQGVRYCTGVEWLAART